MRKTFVPVILAGACSALFFRCDTMMAGTSAGTGNPTEIQLGFLDSTGPAPFTGWVDVFAATQIPVPGFRSQPLAHFQVDNAREFVLKGEDLASITDTLWPQSSRDGDSLVRFNVVATGEKTGVILRGFGYRVLSKDFSMAGVDSARKVNEERVGVKAALMPLVEAHAKMDPRSLDFKDKNYLFVYGTGISAKVDSGSGRFTFARVPKGHHEIAFISIPRKPGIGNDSIAVYGSVSPLNTDKTDSISVAGILELVPYPR